MRAPLLLAALALLPLGAALAAGEAAARPTTSSFRAVDVWVDSGTERLAAYQVEVTYDAARVRIVGVEGGEPAGFRDAPWFDEAGKTGGRIVLAAFVPQDSQAVNGARRVARLHLQVEGDAAPALTVKLVAAAKPGGERIKAGAVPRLAEGSK
ncbi:MAG TPA: hypothetical protein PK280_17030 [Planctomycetota bacterium]|nr:hypothetical protein [Planctomycetota bacterium]